MARLKIPDISVNETRKFWTHIALKADPLELTA
jgi:hypothetical protein